MSSSNCARRNDHAKSPITIDLNAIFFIQHFISVVGINFDRYDDDETKNNETCVCVILSLVS